MFEPLTVYEFITVGNTTKFPLVTSASPLQLFNVKFMGRKGFTLQMCLANSNIVSLLLFRSTYLFLSSSYFRIIIVNTFILYCGIKVTNLLLFVILFICLLTEFRDALVSVVIPCCHLIV